MPTLNRKIVAILATTVVGLAFFASASANAALKTPDDRYVRTANYFLRAGTDITPAQYPLLAEYDLLVFPAEAQVYNRAMFAELRRLNPTIIILAYVPTKSWNSIWSDPLHQKLRAGIQNDWWLLDSQGRPVSVWPGTQMLNAVIGWQDYLPQFVHDEIWGTGLWDGVLYDEFSANVSWVNGGDLDLHRNGRRTDGRLADIAWKQAMINLLKRSRDLLGAEAVIITNGDSTGELQPYVNGRMFESFPTPWEAGGTWPGVTANYLRLQGQVGYPPVLVINANTGNSGNNADFRQVRFTLGSTLLGGGFFSYDFGESDHGQLWRYDEEEARLGRPLGSPINLLNPAKRDLAAGVWRRDFERGAVLVNSTGETRQVKFNEEMEKLRGTQDSTVNDGSVVTSVTLPPRDGLILLKPLANIVGSAFPNGAYVRLFNAKGEKVRNGFFAYVPPFGGLTNVALQDIDGDGANEKIVADKSQVSIFGADSKLRTQFRPYGADYSAGVSLAFGDVDGDGKIEIVTGTGAGASPQIRVFKPGGEPAGKAFYGYDAAFRGGVQVAVGDVNGDGRAEIIAGAGVGGGPHVRIFSGTGRLLHPGFFAYDPKFRGGVQVAVGDVNGDGRAEIITGAGPGGGPHVRIFNNRGRVLSPGFFAADPSSRSGVRVAVADTDGDGIYEIAALTTDIFQFSLAK